MKDKLKIIVSISILIIAIICIVFFAMNKKMSKDEMLNISQKIELQEFNKDVIENKERAKDKYEKNIYEITGFITDIADKTIVVEDNNSKFVAYVSKEDIKKIDKNQKISIVGKVEKIDIEEKENMVAGNQYKTTKAVAELRNACIIEDTFEIVGTIVIPEKKYYLYDSVTKKNTLSTRKETEWYCSIDKKYDITDFAETKKFAEDGESIVAGVSVKDKEIVKFTGKIIRNIKRNSAGVESTYDVKELKIIKSEN